MIKKVLFLGFILTTNLIARPEITQISGRLPGAEGYEIRLIGYSDYITFTEVVIDRTVVDTTGSFYLKADLRETTAASLDLDYYSAKLVLEPGKMYNIRCDSVDMASQYRPFYEKDDINFNIVPEDNLELNFLISTFNLSYNKFITDNFDNIYLRRKKGLIDSFRAETEQKYSTCDIQYFSQYIAYKIAQTELSAGSVNKALLFKKFLDNKPVQYSNPEYMYFFNQFFDGYIAGESKEIGYSDLGKAINDFNLRDSVLVAISTDSILKGERIRELVMLKTLFDLYYNTDFSQINILHILRQVDTNSEFTEHRLIATNMIRSLIHLQKGTQAPDFRLPDIAGDTVALSDFRGKRVYLSFMTTWTYACLAEFDILAKLYKDYGMQINFISVSLDKSLDTLKRFVKDKDLRWTFLYNGAAWDLIHLYGIKTFPLFVLISEDGRIMQYPAYKPSEGIEEAFQK